MRKIALARIDDRLIHGQVVTSWLKHTDANRILIADDKIPSNPLMSRVLRAAAPPNTVVLCYTVAKSIEYIKQDEDPKERLVILVKGPEVYEAMLEAGIEIPTIILGGMVNRADREGFIKNVAVTPEEKDCFRRIVARGTKVLFQRLVNDNPEDIEHLL